jgi:hypothetical protein
MNRFYLSLLATYAFALSACTNTVKPAPPPNDVPAITQPAQVATAVDEPLPDDLTLEYRACETDADCVLALNGCCDCANGGRDIAVSRARLTDFTARFRCSGACTERAGDCGRGTISCLNKLCTFGISP